MTLYRLHIILNTLLSNECQAARLSLQISVCMARLSRSLMGLREDTPRQASDTFGNMTKVVDHIDLRVATECTSKYHVLTYVLSVYNPTSCLAENAVASSM